MSEQESYKLKLKRLLNPPQYDAATSLEGPLLILAGAGSGKTRSITYRTVYMLKTGISPKNILCVTFTNKASKEMKERIVAEAGKELGSKITISTYHSFCIKLLMKYGHLLGFGAKFNIYTSSDQQQVRYEILKDLGMDPGALPMDEIAAEISSAKNDLISPDNYPEETAFEKATKVVYQRYQKYLKHMGAMDFDDMLYYTAELLTGHPEILDKVQKRFKYIQIDEYQDTNKAQYAIARLLAGSERNIAVVGDDDQSIYAWRGADITNILNFEKDFPGTKTIKLEQNYRSTVTILDAANSIIKNNEIRKDKTLWSGLGDGDKIKTMQSEDPWVEAEAIADDISLQNVRYHRKFRDICILFRTNAQAKPLETAFFDRKIPFKVSGKLDFYERREIKDTLAYIKLLNKQSDDLSLLRIVNFPNRGIGSGTISKIKEIAMGTQTSIFDTMKKLALDGSIKEESSKSVRHFVSLIEGYSERMIGKEFPSVLKDFFHSIDFLPAIGKYDEDPKIAEIRRRNVLQLLDNIEAYAKKSKKPSLSDFLIKLALFFTSEEEEEELKEDAVHFLTIHASKGLEFPYVYIVGFEENMLPYVRDPQVGCNLPEERRLCYVAMTRAQKELVLSLCKYRKRDGVTLESVPSRFLSEIPDPLILRNYGEYSDETPKKEDESLEEFASRSFADMKELLK